MNIFRWWHLRNVLQTSSPRKQVYRSGEALYLNSSDCQRVVSTPPLCVLTGWYDIEMMEEHNGKNLHVVVGHMTPKALEACLRLDMGVKSVELTYNMSTLSPRVEEMTLGISNKAINGKSLRVLELGSISVDSCGVCHDMVTGERPKRLSAARR